MSILIGTSGYSYQDWVGPFYPKGTRKQDFLSYYAQRFNTCELNFSYYRMPTSKITEGMVHRSGGGVKFAVKLYKGFTHEVHNTDTLRELAAAFINGVAPLYEKRALGPLLAQFPYSFKKNLASLQHLRTLRKLFDGFDLVIEFRNKWWLTSEVFDFLREHELGFCCVDEPDLKGLPEPIKQVTSRVAYVRFHGRNKAKWWNHDKAWERYDYEYNDEELMEWIPDIKKMSQDAEETYVYMNNHYLGQAIRNAKDVERLL